MDATRVDHLSLYGYSKQTSPFIDSFGEKAVVYKQAISPSSWTFPSMASLFTGMFPSRHNTDRHNPYLRGDFKTLAEVLTDNGYETIAITDGSWISPLTNFNRGFKYFLKLWQFFQDSSNIASYRTVKTFNENGFTVKNLINILKKGNFVKNIINSIYGKYLYKKFDYGAEKINRLTTSWLKNIYTREKPLFLYTHYMEAHLEYKPPKNYKNLFLKKGDNPSKVNQNAWDYICQKVNMDEEDFRILRALYDAEIRYQDSRIRELYEYLGNFIDIDNTLFLITADHGENLGEHGLMDHQYCVYDTLIHVPLIIKFPKGEFEGITVDSQVQTFNIFYTVLERIGINPEELNQLDADSLIPSNTKKDKLAFAEYLYPQPKAEIIRTRYPSFDYKKIDRKLKCIRTMSHKYILSSAGEEELYNIIDDPQETINIAHNYPNLCGQLKEILIKTIKSFDTASIDEKEIDKEMKKRLESLGYI